MQSQYQQIIELIRKRDVVLFIGSGFSIKAGAPSGMDLCEILYDALPDRVKNEGNLKAEFTLQKLSGVYETHHGRNALIDILKIAFNFERKDITDQKQLANIPFFKQIITTNYDSLIEDAYADNCNLVVTNSDLSKIDQHKTTIYKIHGDFSYPENIVITQKDYNKLYDKSQENLIWDTVRAEFSRHNVLFIGYSLSDQNIQILIDNVKKQMGNSAKQLFVLIPDIGETARLQLEEIGAKYIQGKAEDLFKDLIPALKDHIIEDYEAKNTSVEDCDHFLREYDLQAGFELGGPNKPNRLLAVKSVSGNMVHHTINFTLTGNGTENPLEQIKPYYDERFGNLPVKKINDFHGFEYRANDILISRGENVASIFFVPIPMKGEICFSIPQKNILLKRTCRYYNNWNHQVQIDADIDIGILEILIPILPNKEEGIRFKQSVKYTNNNTAIEWENLFVALFSGYEFTLTITSEAHISRQFTFAFQKSKLKQQRKDAKQALLFYKYIHGIELLLQSCFNEYENFSNDNLFAAEIIYFYLKKEPLIIRHPLKGFTHEVEVASATIKPNPNKEFAYIQSVQDVCCELNGKEFKIPHMQQLYQQSVLKSMRRNDKGNIILQFIDKAKEHRIQLTDKPLQIETEEGIVEL